MENQALTILALLSDRQSGTLAILAEETLNRPDTGIGIEVAEKLSLFFWVLLFISAVLIAIFVIPRIIKHIHLRKEKSIIEERLQEAQKNEKAGELVSAALIYEKLRIFDKAAGLYERGRDFIRAAYIYESLGKMKKVKEMYEKAGDLNKAAETCMATGDYIEAARIYSQQGDTLRTAKALEMSGNRLAAVRAYREAKDYIKASLLLKEEGLHKEAAEMYGISLTDEDLQVFNIDKFYRYATLLETAGELDKASALFKEIIAIEPDYMDVQERLKAMGIHGVSKEPENRAEETNLQVTEVSAKKETTLRNLIQSGRMEPRHSLRLWVQILKALAENHRQGRSLSNLSPESISIDAVNNVMFSETASRNFAYIAPEVISGKTPDQISAIYSMGVILYEMLTGSLDSLGIKKPSEVIADIPAWLEELSIKCTDKERDKRYQSLDEIFSTLKALKNKM